MRQESQKQITHPSFIKKLSEMLSSVSPAHRLPHQQDYSPPKYFRPEHSKPEVSHPVAEPKPRGIECLLPTPQDQGIEVAVGSGMIIESKHRYRTYLRPADKPSRAMDEARAAEPKTAEPKPRFLEYLRPTPEDLAAIHAPPRSWRDVTIHTPPDSSYMSDKAPNRLATPKHVTWPDEDMQIPAKDGRSTYMHGIPPHNNCGDGVISPFLNILETIKLQMGVRWVSDNINLQEIPWPLPIAPPIPLPSKYRKLLAQEGNRLEQKPQGQTPMCQEPWGQHVCRLELSEIEMQTASTCASVIGLLDEEFHTEDIIVR